MIGILGGMGTQAGLDFCNKIAKLYKGKIDQNYPKFLLYNKSNIPSRVGNIKNYKKVLKSLVIGCNLLQKNKCKFITIPCNTAHYWFGDLQKKIKIPILNMPQEVYIHAKKNCKINSRIGLLATETTIKTKIYDKFFEEKFDLICPIKRVQISNVNKCIKLVKMGKIKEAEKAIKPAVKHLIQNKCKKIILGCTELPIAIFAFKSFKKIKMSKIFLDPNLILAKSSINKIKTIS